MRPLSLKFHVTAAFLGLLTLFMAAGIYAIGAFQRQLAYDALVEIAGRLELAAEQIYVQGMNYKQNAPRDYRTYYRDVRLYYQDLMAHVATFDEVVEAFMNGDFHDQVPTPLPWMQPRLGATVAAAVRELERVWSQWRQALIAALGDDPDEPRLEWAAEHVIAEQEALGQATAALTQMLRAWTAREYHRVIQGAIGAGAAAILVAVLLLVVLNRRVLAPLRATTDGFQRVAEGDFGERLPVVGTAEIRHLAVSFNRLSVRLDLLYQLIQRLQQGKDLDELVGFLSRDFADFLGCHWIGVVVIDEAHTSARVETAWVDGQPRPGERRLYRLRGTLLEAVLATQRPRQIGDMAVLAAEHEAYELLRHLVAIGMRDAMFLPLTPQTGTPVPAVIVVATRQTEGFDAGQSRLLGNIAQLLTQAFGRTARFVEQGRLAAIGEFASGIAHELRSPMSTVSMALEYLADQSLPDRAQRRAELGAQEAQRMRRLLDDILTYAKPLSLSLQPVDLASGLRELIDGYAANGTRHDLRLDLALPHATVLADVDRLRQIFVNLTDNACEAAPDGAQVTWRLTPAADSGWVLISIHNPGEAIPAALLARLPQPFVSTKPGGTGLGLAIVRRLVELHGGALRIESAAGKGTRVEIRLPSVPV